MAEEGTPEGEKEAGKKPLGCREIQKPFPRGKAHPSVLKWGWDGDPALLHHPCSMIKGTRLHQTQTNRQTQTDEGYQVEAAGQKMPLTRHPSLDSWPVPRPRRAGARLLAWLV